LAAAKEFGNCQTRVWQLPKSLATAKPDFGSCQRVWQLPNPILAAAKPEFGAAKRFNPSLAAAEAYSGSCQNRVWQLPNPNLAAAKLGSQTLVRQLLKSV